jgi:tetratricopeptide (TPR) repeat protein
MDKRVVEELRAEANHGIDAVKDRQADQASVYFTNALNRACDIKSVQTRRDEVFVLARLFIMSAFPDLAVMAYEEAIELDEQLGHTGKRALDMLELGNAHSVMENYGEAERLYRDALKVFLDEKDFSNAASANTNIAGLVVNRGDLTQGIATLQKSLDYLAKKPFEETEMQTRFGLLRLYEQTQYDADQSADNAHELCARFLGAMRPDQRNVAEELTRKIIARYCKAHPEIDGNEWAKKNFPML